MVTNFNLSKVYKTIQHIRTYALNQANAVGEVTISGGFEIYFSNSVCLITQTTIVNLSTRSQQNTSSIF